MSEYTRWYRVGDVSCENGQTVITGYETLWASAGISPGDLFTTDNGKRFYEIYSVEDETHLTLRSAYEGETTTENISYAIVRQFNATLPARIAAWASHILLEFDTYINTEMQRITGKSAYDIAVDEGYTGTKAQWVESLKAAGEWALASSRLTTLEGTTNTHTTNIGTMSSLTTTEKSSLVGAVNEIDGDVGNLSTLTTTETGSLAGAVNEIDGDVGDTSTLTTTEKSSLVGALNEIVVYIKHNDPERGLLGLTRNHQYRGDCIGTRPTAEQFAEIQNGTFRDMYLGDYWEDELTYNDYLGNSVTKTLIWMIVKFTSACLGRYSPSNGTYRHVYDASNSVTVFLKTNNGLFKCPFWDNDTAGKCWMGSYLYINAWQAVSDVVDTFFYRHNMVSDGWPGTGIPSGTSYSSTGYWGLHAALPNAITFLPMLNYSNSHKYGTILGSVEFNYMWPISPLWTVAPNNITTSSECWMINPTIDGANAVSYHWNEMVFSNGKSAKAINPITKIYGWQRWDAEGRELSWS